MDQKSLASCLVLLVLCLIHAASYAKSRSIGYSSKDSHLIAHFLPQFLSFIVLAVIGTSNWWGGMPADISDPTAPFPAGERLALIMTGFQVLELF